MSAAVVLRAEFHLVGRMETEESRAELLRAVQGDDLAHTKWLIEEEGIHTLATPTSPPLLPTAEYVADHGYPPGHPCLVHAAVLSGSLDMLGYIHGLASTLGVWEALVDVPDESGSTPLMHAVQGRNGVLVAFLLEGKADPSVSGSSGQAPLHVLLQNGPARVDYDILSTLIAGGADYDAPDAHGKVPSSYAIVQAVDVVADALAQRRAAALEEAAREEAAQERARRRVERSALVDAPTRAALGRARRKGREAAQAANAKRVVELSIDDMLAKETALGLMFSTLPGPDAPPYVPPKTKRRRKGKKSSPSRPRR